MTKKQCPLGEACDLTTAWMAGAAKAQDQIKAQAAEIKKLRGDLKKAVDAASSAAVDWLHGDYGMSEARAADLGIYSFVKRAALKALRGAKP